MRAWAWKCISMPLSAAVGSFNTGTGAIGTTVVVSGLGFAPKLILFWWNGRVDTIDAVGRRTHQRGFGAAIGATDRRNMTSLSQDTPTSMVTNKSQDDTECIFLTTTADAIDGKMDMQSMDAGGFTLVVDDVFIASYRVQYLAIGGDDLTNVISSFFTKQAGTGNQDITTAGFQPDLVLLFSSKQTTMGGTIAVDSDFMIGAAASANQQACITGGSNDASNTSIVKSYCKQGECIAFMDTGFTSVTDRATFVSMLSNGFQINWLENAGAAHNVSYIALKGMGAVVGDLLTMTDTTTDIVESGFGFSPRAAMFVSHGKAQSTADTIQADDALSIGAFSGTAARAAMCTFDDDAAATAVVGTAVENDAVYIHMPNTAATVDGLMDIKSIDSSGFTCIMDDADPAQSFVWYFAVGDTPGPEPEIKHAVYRN